MRSRLAARPPRRLRARRAWPASGVALLVFPQMLLTGALIPIQSSSGLLRLLAKLMPMSYSIDLARNIFYAGKPEYAFAALHRSGWISR